MPWSVAVVGMLALALGLYLVIHFWMTRKIVEVQRTTPRKPKAKVCESCAHFDLEEGQAAMRLHPMFCAVAEVVSPAQMAEKVKPDGVTIEAPPIPLKTKWSDFGACLAHNEGVLRIDQRAETCADFEERDDE